MEPARPRSISGGGVDITEAVAGSQSGVIAERRYVHLFNSAATDEAVRERSSAATGDGCDRAAAGRDGVKDATPVYAIIRIDDYREDVTIEKIVWSGSAPKRK